MESKSPLNMSWRATGRVSPAIMVSWLVLVIKADELDRPAWTLRRGLPMETSLSTNEEAQRLDFEVLYLLKVEDAE
ncbi:hypothetical protein GOB14_11840 [Sinorhizobium meliloti]|nr:hypothetical protein [Sinorhizobium meliloti]